MTQFINYITLKYLPDQFKSQEMCDSVVDQFKTQDMCNKAVDVKICTRSLYNS